ncbi:hypothetical protein ACRE_006960 [Hapsidospora chrysogenum ATCC 11550]|uniref:EDC4-like protein pdc1 beta-propeller domain-containing protein n=1 Tax=Hapsidospora chrysogenum (strain ATCC 11550 / CBS 779.69 / DSM 880 / IAM 14645 / JCM 23072 / IMI 49137) TaxID=857340 RepID=A0A086TGK2_HAPC1|nr:hypothetical protein ACRE_006960 [Hapsidospora chrysogenum ATCC 11550]
MDHLPPAPTPPVNNGTTSNMASGSDRTANLLNLLKFSGANAHQQRQQQQQQQQQQPQPQQQSPREQDHPQPQPHHASPPQHHEQQSYQQHQPPQPQPLQSHQPSHHQHHQQQPSVPQAQFSPRIHQPAPASADPKGLLAALMRGAHDSESPAPRPQEHHDQPPPQHPLPQQAPQPANPFSNGTPPPDTRSYLLNLLNRPKPSQNEQPLLTEASRSNNDTSQSPELGQHAREYLAQFQPHTDAYTAAKQYQAKVFAEAQRHVDAYPSHPPGQQQDTQADVNALYQHLIGNLAQQSSPQGSNSHHSNAGHSNSSFHILKKDHSSPAGSQHQGSQPGGSAHSPVSPRDLHRHNVDRTSSLHSHQSASHHSASHHTASKATPTSTDFDRYPPPEHGDTVSAAVFDVAEKADLGAREALDRAEHEQTQADIAEELDQMLNADSDREFHRSARLVAQDLRKELDRSDNEGALEDTLPADVADTVREIVDQAADQNVADSWESADQDEIVVIEEKEGPAVKVFNFPMKPWISISLQEGTTDPRPEFRDEAIMDIARLKKEFDQIDRNLYTASPNYMTYGMSKQGGLRVIRQDDGKDAKVFTDTKDRIFNVAMSVTPSDHDGAYKEAIIGTGISGTVYWVQIRDGEKDHIEDAHLEQYGFALPPMSSSEGDTPGGVLKTRARASTSHPEFFAVGRGKTINFIWPSYIMQNNLFKPGHDRVVDTEKLSQQCSLKINTGKAGKDFAFSQDDSVVASLDKSGRVKFWDVRDLTAVKEGSDPRNPVPAHSSLEVREPLMTLASTPEGEKAWPTSVLLLDKQRPYQKRCALRYMIVGMKQNHTLQLWDLALGKPVQEFNLPHSKESDAVCSVMYHPASGMIVIGHPTRNSVYFAHLSAPKYNLKSVSQAEYIQRLVSQDSSIPQPDSTAVISGVREYSFENRGILRSLDILANPAMVQDSDEPTLFELYAMHSKGVACLLIKQRELGWSNDNKVLAPVDAVSQGVVVVDKLKTLQAPETAAAETPQSRNGGRAAAKETVSGAANKSNESARVPEPTTPAKAKHEPKEAETPAQSSSKENQPEKPERKSRKKKGAAGNQQDATTNGAVHHTPAHKSDKGAHASTISAESMDAAVQSMESRLTASLADTLKSSLKNLNGKIDEGARSRDEKFNQHQLKLLDMVSEVLNENTQKVLEALIHQQFTELVIPAIGDKAGKAVTDLLNHKLQPNISSAVQKEIQNALPHAISRSLRSGDFISAISDRVGASVASTVQSEVLTVLTQRLTPTLTTITSQAAQQMSSELRQQTHEQYEYLKAQRAADSNKIDKLQNCVQQLTEMISTMAHSQASLQAEIMKLKQSPVHELPGVSGVSGHHGVGGPSISHQGYGGGHPVPGNKAPSHQGSYASNQAPSQTQPYMGGSPQYVRGTHHVGSPSSAPQSEQVGPVTNVGALAGAFATQMNKTEAEADHDLVQRTRLIEQAIQEGRLQEAMIQWIQSGREDEIFKRCLCRYPPEKFEALPPLMLLVVIATISKNLKPNPRLKEEIDWIQMAVRAFRKDLPNYEWENQGQRGVAESTSQTIDLLINRVRPLIDGIQDGYPTDPFLANIDRGKLEWIVRTSAEILDSFSGYTHYE